MVVLVISKIREALVRSRFYSSVVGDSMLARLRNSTIALLGAVTVVGLGLVAFISQLGFPGVFNGAIPDGPSGSVAVHDAIALTQGTRVGHQELRGQRVSARSRSSLLDSSGPTGPAVSADLGSSKQAGHRSTEHPPSVTPHPPSAPAPEPVGEPEIPPPAPTASTPGPPEPNSSAQPEKASSAKSNPKAKGHSQGKSEGQAEAKSDVSSSGGSQSHHSAKVKQHSGASPKSIDHSPGKPSSTKHSPSKPSKPGTSPSTPSSAPPPPESAEKKSAEAGNKETGHAGKSGKSHH